MAALGFGSQERPGGARAPTNRSDSHLLATTGSSEFSGMPRNQDRTVSSPLGQAGHCPGDPAVPPESQLALVCPVGRVLWLRTSAAAPLARITLKSSSRVWATTESGRERELPVPGEKYPGGADALLSPGPPGWKLYGGQAGGRPPQGLLNTPGQGRDAHLQPSRQPPWKQRPPAPRKETGVGATAASSPGPSGHSAHPWLFSVPGHQAQAGGEVLSPPSPLQRSPGSLFPASRPLPPGIARAESFQETRAGGSPASQRASREGPPAFPTGCPCPQHEARQGHRPRGVPCASPPYASLTRTPVAALGPRRTRRPTS